MRYGEETYENRKWQREIPAGSVPLEGTESTLRIGGALVFVPIQTFTRDQRIAEPGILALGQATVVRVLDDPGPMVQFDPTAGRGDHFWEKTNFTSVYIFLEADDNNPARIVSGSTRKIDAPSPGDGWAKQITRPGKILKPKDLEGAELWQKLTDLVEAKTFSWKEVHAAFGSGEASVIIRQAAGAAVMAHVKGLEKKERMQYFSRVSKMGVFEDYEPESLGPYVEDEFENQLTALLAKSKTPIDDLAALVKKLTK